MEAQRPAGMGGLMRYAVTTGGATRTVDIDAIGPGRFRVVVDGVAHDVDLHRPTPEAYQFLLDGVGWEAGCVPAEGGFLVDLVGLTTFVAVEHPRRASLRHAAGATTGVLTAQMPGRVVRVLVSAGDPVAKGQPVLVVEAMKMENELKAPLSGTVAELYVVEGAAVETGARLFRVDG